MLGMSESGIGDGNVGVVGGPGDVEPPSAMGSSERENVDVDGLGVGGNEEFGG